MGGCLDDEWQGLSTSFFCQQHCHYESKNVIKTLMIDFWTVKNPFKAIDQSTEIRWGS